MDAHRTSNQAAGAAPKWLLWVRGLLLTSAAGAGYLAWEAIHHGAVAGCGLQSGCSAVLQSPWAYWLDVPVSLPAVLVYLAWLMVTFRLPRKTAPDEQRGVWAAMIVLSVMVGGAALWFIGLQVWVIHSLCRYCLAAHACGLTAAILCLIHIPLATEPATPMWATGSGKRGVPPAALLPLFLVGLAGVAILAGGQWLVPKTLNVVTVSRPAAAVVPALSSNAASNHAAADSLPHSPDARLTGPRTLSLYGHQFVIPLDSVPAMGSLDAQQVIVCMEDYTCSHCRRLHAILRQASELFSNQLAIVCLPVSLAPQCNPFTAGINSGAHPEACDLARLSLAVWRANPQLHPQFEDWMMADAQAPDLAKARDHAAQLVGAERLTTALADPWVAQQFQTDCLLHRANWMVSGTAGMPQIVLGNAVSSGPINSLEHLQYLLQVHLGLAPRAGASQGNLHP